MPLLATPVPLRTYGVLSGLLLLLAGPLASAAQPVDIRRVEQMPALPEPYEMRDWKAVARGFDAFVFDGEASGEHLPVLWQTASGPNYPELGSFGIHSYVGTSSPESGEAITALPALVGATLVGIDKRAGTDWVAMAQQYFNRRPDENVYLNSPAARSGSDWWYDTMPNLFFYQLYDLYGSGVGDFAFQFRSVADRWLAAVEAMGAGTTPWTVPEMGYRAFALSTMTPLAEGVPEPEAAGAIAWLLYHAYVETGEERYRLGAEAAMEYLDGRTSNPSYELQLPYGAYAAARMNAELGTTYDVEQLVRWTFDVGPLRQWGAILGTWGGLDVDGLIGEASVIHRDYAFLFNGFHQAAALVPLVRYDDRFARTVGRWMGNLASASRLFYPGFLPPDQQDGAAWTAEHDSEAVIGHEALREVWLGETPYATGDAVDGGWARTNLSLYSSASVGYLGALIDTTDVPGILRLNARATDFFADGYPTYLYYNPYDEAATVTLPLPEGSFTLYDAAQNAPLASGAADTYRLSLPPDAARLVVLVPADRPLTTEGNRIVAGGRVVDYDAGSPPANTAPRIKALAATDTTFSRNTAVLVHCTAEDRDGDALAYAWSASTGTFDGEGAAVRWTPDTAGAHTVACSASDPDGASARDTLRLTILANQPPAITHVAAGPAAVDPGGTTTLTCAATDPDGDALTYIWSTAEGTLAPDGETAAWTLPDMPGYAYASCTATDAAGGTATDSVGVAAGRLVLHLPLDGAAEDVSGFANAVVVEGAVPTADRTGTPDHAYRFDGTDDHLRVPAAPWLNFTDEITVGFWVRLEERLGREVFIVSHGSWQNRWKLSVTPEQRLRWTIKTADGTYDLDDPALLAPDTYAFVTATYDGETMQLYRNGEPIAERPASGPLATTELALTVGQMVPGDTQYNLRGDVDAVRLYNRALTAGEVATLYATAVPTALPEQTTSTRLEAPYPNPFAATLTIPYTLAEPGPVRLAVYDLLGRRVALLADQVQPAGQHTARWTGRDVADRLAPSGVYIVRLRTPHADVHQTVVLLPQ